MNTLALYSSFIAVVELGSFTKAAKQLGKTKAIVSRQVNQLEAELGQRLLNRTTRSVSVTDQGREVYQRLRHIMDEIANLKVDDKSTEETLSGRLRISAPQTFGELKLMPILPAFMEQHPHLNVELQLNDQYLDIVQEGFDLAVRVGILDDSNLIARQVSSIKQLLVASPEFLAQHDPITTPADLPNLPCIHDSNRRSGSKWLFMKDGQTLATQIHPKLRVNGATAAAMAASQGLGLTVSPDFAVKSAIEQNKLVALLTDYQIDNIENVGVYAVYPHRRYTTRKVNLFIDYLLEHLADSY